MTQNDGNQEGKNTKVIAHQMNQFKTGVSNLHHIQNDTNF